MRSLALASILLFLCARSMAATTTTQPLAKDDLIKLYRTELGRQFVEPDADKLIAAHQQLEKYFASTSAETRKSVVATLETSGIDPNILGRLCRIRMDWANLQPGVYYINERVGPHEVQYFLGVPKGYDRLKSWPMVVKLPTADAFVGNPKPDANAVQTIYTNWLDEELAKHPDAICVMPLLNLDDLWGPSYAGMNRVIQPILHAPSRVNIDPARVYLIGHSMSAHAAWNIALHYPTYLAAFNPLAGACTNDWARLRFINLRNVLPVVWHDVNDDLIKVNFARSIITVLKRLKIEVDYTETTKVGHVPSEAIVEAEYAKLRARVRQLYPKQISLQSNRPETLFNRIDWFQVYQALNPGQEQKLAFRRRPGSMTIMSNTFTANATIEGNRIDVTSDNCEVMRIYVNDQMIDFTRPVTVVVNKKGRFEAMVKPDVDEMLKDQVFIGRGARYFTGVIDVDLAPKSTAASGPATRP